MHEQMRSVFRKKIGSVRRPSLAGDGLPERMRTTAFAFLGLTAAAGLALVAIFAQLGFPLLSPAPLPSATEPSAIGRAVPLEDSSAAVGLAQAQGAVPVFEGSRDQGASSGATRGDRGSAGVDASAEPVSNSTSDGAPSSPGPQIPASTPTPAPAPATTTPTPSAESPPAPVEVPVSSPETGTKPDKSKAVASKPGNPDKTEAKPEKPEAKPDRPDKIKPVKPPKSKPAKPEAKPAKPEAAPAPEPKYVPAPPPPSASKDKKKEETGKKDK